MFAVIGQHLLIGVHLFVKSLMPPAGIVGASAATSTFVCIQVNRIRHSIGLRSDNVFTLGVVVFRLLHLSAAPIACGYMLGVSLSTPRMI